MRRRIPIAKFLNERKIIRTRTLGPGPGQTRVEVTGEVHGSDRIVVSYRIRMSEDVVEVTGEVVDRTGEVTGTAARQLVSQVKLRGIG